MRLHPLTRNTYGCPSTRRYPRSLAEAWPADYADPIERHPSARSWLLADGLIAALLVVVLVALLFGVL